MSDSKTSASIELRLWELNGVFIERYRYSSGFVEPLSKHSHDEYQFGLSFDCQGEYNYRGQLHYIPKGSLSILQSGEVHAPSERRYLESPATFLMMYTSSVLMQTVATELARSTSLPFFQTTYAVDQTLVNLFLHLHECLETPVSKLQQDSLLVLLLTRLIEHHAHQCPPIQLKKAKSAIQRVCAFLHEEYTTNVSLQELASLAGLSPFYLCRAFRKATGMTLHAYQIQVRISRAKRLLMQGRAISEVAFETGFYDQSHFGANFKRLVGVTPGQYRKGQ